MRKEVLAADNWLDQHLGFAVKDLAQSREFYRSMFGLASSDPITSEDGTMQASLVEVGGTIIELLQPVGSEGVMAKHLEKRGEGFHHICYEVDDIRGMLFQKRSNRAMNLAVSAPANPQGFTAKNRTEGG